MLGYYDNKDSYTFFFRVHLFNLFDKAERDRKRNLLSTDSSSHRGGRGPGIWATFHDLPRYINRELYLEAMQSGLELDVGC